MTYPQPPAPPQPPPLDAAQSLAPALRYTWAMLTRPFSLRRWLALALIALLAGLFGGGGVNIPSGDWSGNGTPADFEPYLSTLLDFAHQYLALLIALGAFLLLLTLVTVYLAAVFRFVFLDAVARNRVATRQAFAENWDRGLSLFLWHFGFGLAAVILVGGLVLAVVFPVLSLRHDPAGGSIAAIVILVILGVLVGVVLAVALVVISITLTDFVLPVMYLEDRGIWAAWRRALGLIRRQLGPFALYFLLKIPVGIAAGIASGLLALAGMVVALIPVGLIALIGVAIALADQIGWAWTPATIFLAVFGGGIVLIYLFYATACTTLPVVVFRQAWALWFLGERDRRLAVLRLPPVPGV